MPAKPSTLRSSSSSSPSKTTTKISNSSTLELKTSSTASSSSAPKPLDLKLSHVICPESNKIIAPSNLTAAQQQAIDISILREKSKNLDLPLISALCNDRSLLKQTKAFVMPKHPRTTANPQITASLSSKAKYPVSGLSTTQLSKTRKTNVSHRHPNDKLPPLPVQTGNKNNYVMDPIPLKQKTNQNAN